MTHRDRVAMALHHEKPDRCPMQISYTPEFENRIRREIDQLHPVLPIEVDQSTPYDLERAFDQDLLLAWSGRLCDVYEKNVQELEDGSTMDDWGIIRKNIQYETRFGTGIYSEMIGHPLQDDTKIDSYATPDPTNPLLYQNVINCLEEHQDEYWIVGCAVTTIFETAWALRGFENLLMDFMKHQDVADKILDIPYHYHLQVATRLARLGVDMIWFGDDVGTQHTMLLSPDTWRKFFKHRMAGLFTAVKNINPQLKIAYHSDGYIYPIIPDLIEIGLDVLNPIQPNCMAPEKLKEEFGDVLCFWGAIDEQYLLPFAGPNVVQREIGRLIKSMGKNGGFILSPTHNVQLDTPMENFKMMIDTIRGKN